MNFAKPVIVLTLTSFFSLATIGDIKQQGQLGRDNSDSYHITDNVSRAEQVQKCASCHREVYENELIGPHATAYTNVLEHIEHVKNSPNFNSAWKQAVLMVDRCAKCHASENLYETVFSGLEAEVDETKYSSDHYPDIFSQALPRDNGASRMSGIDCLTCHVKNNKVITSESFKPSGIKMEGQCDVMPSKFFSHNLNCITCHKVIYKNTLKNVENGLVTVEDANCIKCHQEYDENGKGTHYYYWKHDAPGKTRTHNMDLFSCVSVSLKQSGDTKYIVFNWQNQNAPHQYPECAEYIVDVKLITGDNDTVFLGSERINKKEDQGPEILKLFKDDHPGIAGYCNYVGTEPLLKEYPVASIDISKAHVLVILKLKTQYFSLDAEAKYLESRIYEL